MQLDILIHHIESDARAYLCGSLLLLGTIETLEDMGLFFLGDTAACILYDDTGITTTIDEALAQFYFYHSTSLRKLESIGEQVGQYLTQLIPVEIHKESTGLILKLQGDIFLFRKGAKLHGGILDKLIQIATCQIQSFSIHLHLAEIEQLVDELQQVARILAHLIQLGASLRISGTAQHTADRRDNQGKQGAELVADIGEEAILHLLQLLVLLILHALAVLLNLPSYAEDHQGDEYQEIQELGPPSSPKWSQHLYLQGCRLLAPYLV